MCLILCLGSRNHVGMIPPWDFPMAMWKKVCVLVVPWCLALEGADLKPLLQALVTMAQTARMAKPRKHAR